MAKPFHLDQRYLRLQAAAVVLAFGMIGLLVSPFVWLLVKLGGTSGSMPADQAARNVAISLTKCGTGWARR